MSAPAERASQLPRLFRHVLTIDTRLLDRVKNMTAFSSRVLAITLFEIAFYFAYRYGMSFSQAVASPFWFPDSIMLCALLLSEPRSWPIYVLGALPIRLFSQVARDIPLWFLLSTFAIDSIRGVLTALALRRLIRTRIRIETIKEFALFCVWAVVLIPAASALGGAAARHVLGHDFWPAWQQWFLGNALAHLVVTPAILYWVLSASWKVRVVAAKDWLEAAPLTLGLVATSYLAFGTPSGSLSFAEARFFAPVPFLFWAAIRFGMFGASGAIVVIAFFAVESALAGRGPFTGGSPADTALALQHFLLVRAVPLYLIAIVVEQRRGVERSLRESQERMSLAAIAADLWLWEWNIVQDRAWLTDPNSVQSGLGAFTRVQIDAFTKTLHPDDRENVVRGLAKAMAVSGDYESTYRLTFPDGRLRWMASFGRVEFDAAGRPVRLRGVARDVTRTHQVELQIRQQREELAQLSRIAALGELSGSLAHELRQPLTAILANTQAAQLLLTHERADVKELREILGAIVANDRRAADIIQHMRDLFKRGEIAREPIEVNELVRAVLKFAQPELQAGEIQVSTECADDLPRVSGDRIQLQQLLLNLISNACFAMSDAGAPRDLHVRTQWTEAEGVQIVVSDSGRGIPNDRLARIFEPFFTTRPEGVGLGLTVCRAIVAAHHGKLWAENNPGRGATFHVVLPIS